MTRFVLAALLLLVACRATAQATRTPLADPFTTAHVIHDHAIYPEHAGELRAAKLSARERRAFLAADLTGKGFEARVATRRLAGREFVLVRGWHAEGTGLQELAYYVFASVGRTGGRDSLRLVWQGVAEENFNPGGMTTADGTRLDFGPPYDLRACLYVTPDGRLAYAAREVPARRADDDLPLPEPGYYAWSRAAGTFRRAGPPDVSLRRRCQRARSLVL